MGAHARHRSPEKAWRGLTAILVQRNQREVFYLLEAPSKEAAIVVYREAHGLAADEIVEVKLSS